MKDPNNKWIKTDIVKTAQQEMIKIKKDVEGLRSTSGSIIDNWSLKDIDVPRDGGGIQIYIPKTQ